MIVSDNHRNSARFVIPRWLDYHSAIRSGELALGGEIWIPSSKTFEEDMLRLESSWEPGLATDLLGKAHIEERPEAKQIAAFILKSKNIAEPTRRLARRVIDGAIPDIIHDAEGSLSSRIARLRSRLRSQPKNPTRWVDLARLYTAGGQDGKAFECMRIALALAPQDRFTIRAFSRLCIHTNSGASAIEFFNKNKELLRDPWVLATAESLSKIEGVSSPLPKSIILDANDDFNKFHRSELVGSFAMAEWMHGRDRVAKKAFRAAWEVPSQSVIRHAEWITGRDLPALRSETETRFGDSHEAASRAALKDGDVSEALRRCELWRFEEPYSVHPLGFESFLLCSSERFADVGVCFQKAQDRKLMSTPLFTNYLYATLMLGNSEHGEQLLRICEANNRGDLDYYILANKGLLAISRGEEDTARSLYQKAEESAGEVDPNLEDTVFLHHCRGFLQFGFGLGQEEQNRITEIEKKRDDDSRIQLLVHFIKRKLSTEDDIALASGTTSDDLTGSAT